MDAYLLQQILQLPSELRGAAYEEILSGRKIENLRALAGHIMQRENRSCGFISLDERKEDDGCSAHERLAACDPADLVDFLRARVAVFDDQTEAILDVARQSAAAFGRSKGLSARRGQQILQKQIKRAREEKNFKDGARGQGGLFGFDGVTK